MSDDSSSGWGLQGTLGGTTDENDNPYVAPDSGALDPNFVPSTSHGGGYQYNPTEYNAPQWEQPAWAGSQYTDMQLKDMFANEPGWRTPQEVAGIAPNLNTLSQAHWGFTTDGQPIQRDPNKGSVNWFSPGDTMYKMGFRNPGSDAAMSGGKVDFEQPLERDTRMGMVGDAIGTVGNGVISAMMPAPISMGLNAYNAYQNYQKNPEQGLGKALASALSGTGGYTGALANMYNGNYGSAAASVLGKNGVNPTTSNAVGIGTDYMTGKNVGPALGGFLGQVGGSRIGGTLGGLFGQYLGKTIGQNNSVRK